MDQQVKNKLKLMVFAAAGCFLAGCTCVGTHVPGRHIDHGPNPGGIDRFFCNLDYILFPPEQGYVVAPPPPPPPPPVTVIPEYGYGWWKGTWVPCYRHWYWYHGTWEWGGSGMRPVPPAWAPDFKRRPIPPPPPPPPAPATVIPEYGYGWWKGTWVPCYRNWYWYHGTWEWGGSGMRPVPPAWAPDFKRRPIPPPPPKAAHRPRRHNAPHHNKPRHHPAQKPGDRPPKI